MDQASHSRAESFAVGTDHDEQRVLLIGDLGEQRDGMSVGGVVGPSPWVLDEDLLNVALFLGEGCLGLGVPVVRIGIDGVVGQVDAVHDMQLRVQPHRQVGGDLQRRIAGRVPAVTHYQVRPR